MIDPVTRIAAAPVAPSTSTSADPQPQPQPPAETAPAAAAEPPKTTPEPLSIDVARGENGVFVYTLKDPGTGAVLAVIPREDVQAGRDGRNLDQRI